MFTPFTETVPRVMGIGSKEFRREPPAETGGHTPAFREAAVVNPFLSELV